MSKRCMNDTNKILMREYEIKLMGTGEGGRGGGGKSGKRRWKAPNSGKTKINNGWMAENVSEKRSERIEERESWEGWGGGDENGIDNVDIFSVYLLCLRMAHANTHTCVQIRTQANEWIQFNNTPKMKKTPNNFFSHVHINRCMNLSIHIHMC